MTTDRKFGRIPEFDAKSRAFNIRAVTPLAPRSYTWGCLDNLDQGQTSQCVGYSWTHEAISKPKIRTATAATATKIYKLAQTLDEWPGVSYDGTSVLAGAKAYQQLGFIGEYRWAFNWLDGITGVSRHGPGVIGINWMTGMMDTDQDGYVHYSGDMVGGHAILLRGVDMKNRRVLLHNSWGRSWGGTLKGPGTAWLTFGDLDRALKDQGEFCIPVVRL